jgi:hypothetical protein
MALSRNLSGCGMIYLILNNRLIANNRCVNDNIFEQWKMEHEAKNECGIKFEGSSPAMEAEGELVVWERSISHHNLRYRWMVSDGDSKAHISVYTDCKVEKLDCVGHIHRRMGKHLLNLKANTKGKLDDGKTIGGKGRLTEVKRKKNYRSTTASLLARTPFLSLPRQNRKLMWQCYQMKKNIISTLHHNVSSDNLAKQHKYCRRGEKSWCK